MKLRLISLFAFIAWLLAGPAAAAVEISFHSKDMGGSFPHAFVVLSGSLDGTGEPVNGNYGFSAKNISPAVLLGSVTGMMIEAHGEAYIAASDRHFTLRLSDAEVARVLEVIRNWRERPQPSYNLNRRNCVHFVADVAAALGMRVVTDRLMKKPRSFLEALRSANLAWLNGRGATSLARGEQAR